MSVIKRYDMSCPECGFSTRDESLMNGHRCEVQSNGGRCEDYPCCGHEFGDCNGQKYGSDDAIKEQMYEDMARGYDSWDDNDF